MPGHVSELDHEQVVGDVGQHELNATQGDVDIYLTEEAQPSSSCCSDCRFASSSRCQLRQSLLQSLPNGISSMRTSFLEPGARFRGFQTVQTLTMHSFPSNSFPNSDDCWEVLVLIEKVDFCRGTLSGTMEAINVPQARERVITCWDGEIVDNIPDPCRSSRKVSHSFWTRKWGSSMNSDLDHWKRFGAFEEFRSSCEPTDKQRSNTNDPDIHTSEARKRELELVQRLATNRYIFLRWKEQRFVNVGSDCGLTIAGFYYLCLDRVSGNIEGYYADPHSSPFQHLQLEPLQNKAGHFLPTYTLY